MVPSTPDPLRAPAASPSPAELEARLETLAQRLSQVEARIRRLESGRTGLPEAGPEAPAPGPEKLLEGPSPARILGLAGRVCLILGGAFFLRMLTDSGTIPRGAGVALGLGYAASWAVVAWRTGPALQSGSYALSSVLIAYPLIWESTTTFAILGPAAAAALLLAAAGLHVGVAWARSLKAVAWIATLSTLAAALGLMVATQAIEWFTMLCLALGAGSLWLTYGRRWHALRWPPALAADLAVLVLTILAAWPGGPPEGYRALSPTRAMGLALGLVLIYLGSFAARMLQRRRTLNAFEGIQTGLVLLVGFGGALRVALASGSGAGMLGAGVLAAGLGSYAVACPFAADREELRANFSFFTSLALVFLLLGGPLLLPRGPFALASGLLGLASVALGLRLRRPLLVLHGALFLTAGTVASGLLARTVAAFLGPAAGLGPPSPPAAGLLLLLAVAQALLESRRPPASPAWPSRLPALLIGTQAAFGLGALGVWAGLHLAVAGGPDPGLLASARTCVLSLLAVALAGLGRRFPASELRWLVYPLLALAPLKFLLEDLAAGRPLTLFLAFMAYGAALILAPRFLKATPGPDGTDPPGDL